MRLTEDVKDYVVLVPDEWIVRNPLWSLLAPEIVEAAEQRIAERANPTTDTSGTT
jgi:hypothetical protein